MSVIRLATSYGSTIVTVLYQREKLEWRSTSLKKKVKTKLPKNLRKYSALDLYKSLYTTSKKSRWITVEICLNCFKRNFTLVFNIPIFMTDCLSVCIHLSSIEISILSAGHRIFRWSPRCSLANVGNAITACWRPRAQIGLGKNVLSNLKSHKSEVPP